MRARDRIEEPPDVVGVGHSAIDFLGVVPEFPEENLKIELRRFEIQGGGPAATALVAASRLGLSSSYIGTVGDDLFGRRMIEELRAEGIDTSSVAVKKGAQSQFAFIMVDSASGARTILWTRGTLPFLRSEEVDEGLIRSARVLLIDSLEPEAAFRAAGIARAAGIPVVIDAGTLREGVEELLPLCDYIVASEVFAGQISDSKGVESALEKIFSYGPEAGVITMGEKGCAAKDADGVVYAKGFKVGAVDTTGAGDVFHGAFLYAVLKGWDLYRKCVFSNAVAALKCRELGGRAGIPEIKEVVDFLERERPGLEFTDSY